MARPRVRLDAGGEVNGFEDQRSAQLVRQPTSAGHAALTARDILSLISLFGVRSQGVLQIRKMRLRERDIAFVSREVYRYMQLVFRG